jgi:TrmH family RNA methyltransferase
MVWKKYRPDSPYSFTFGLFPTLELLRQRPQQAREVLLASKGERSSVLEAIRGYGREFAIPVTVNDKLVQRLAPKENTYAVGVFEKYWPVLDGKGDHVVLVNPGDMGNLGTILRTMLGFGVCDLAIIRPGADIFDPRTVRASMGGIFQARFAYFDSFGAYAEEYGRAFYPFMTDGGVDLREARFERPFSLVFGSERAGLPPEFHTLGTSVRIPQEAAIDSLNLPVAVGVALYEALHGSGGAEEQRSRGAGEQGKVD